MSRKKKLLFGLLASSLILVWLEGFASAAFFLADLATKTGRTMSERQHTRYDETLGWVNLPRVHIESLWGPGMHLTTNGQGFRGREDVAIATPPNQVRVICSGDSFTLGYGVDDDHTWVHILQRDHPGLQSVNMGNGGYGLDQACLWFLRDGQPLAHSLHILAFVDFDFERMRSSDFLGYGKPLIRLRDNELVVTGVPVPRRSYLAPWLTENANVLGRLGLWRAMSALIQKLSPRDSSAGLLEPQEVADVTIRLLSKLIEANARQHSGLLVVSLPTYHDPAGKLDSIWSQFMREITKQKGIPYLDLHEDFARLSERQLQDTFIMKDIEGYRDSAGHYTVAGNEFVARTLYTRMQALPQIAGLLGSRPATPAPTAPPVTGR